MHRRVLLVTLCVMLVLSAWPVRAGTFKQGILPPKLAPAVPEGDGQAADDSSAAKPLYRNIEPMYVPSGNAPGLYVARADYGLNLDTYYAVGGHQTFYWSELEPTEGNIQWHLIDNFIANWANKGKRAAFGISVYEGRANERQDRPYLLVPDYVLNAIRAAGRNPTVQCDIIQIPRYWDPIYLEKYRSFISRLAIRYNGDPRIEFIQIGVGKSAENIPCDPDGYYDGESIHYDATCVANAMIAEGFPTPTNKWRDTVDEIIRIYADNFTQTRLFLLQGASFKHACERDGESYYAASRGVGLFPAEIRAYPQWVDFRRSDQEGCGKLDYVLNWSDTLESDGPIDLGSLRPVAFEGYGYMLGGNFSGTVAPDPVEFFWGIAAALSRHPDYITLERTALYHRDTGQPFSTVLPTLEWASQYIGKRIEDTPSVWTILRETGYCYGPGCSSDQRVQIGNYNWWLRQDDDITGGRTKPTTWMAANMLLDPASRAGGGDACEPACLNPNIQAQNTDLPAGAKESWVCRRTDYATGNSFMYFKINDRYRNSRAGDYQARITVTYLDRGYDRWQLEYDSTSGTKVAGTIQKTGSNQWRDAIFDLTDARFLNGMDGGADFRINCLDTGNEYIHKVDVRIGSGPVQSHNIPLKASNGGWNFVSVPLAPVSTAIANVLASIAGKYDQVQYWSNGSWRTYPGGGLENIDQTMGFWIHVTQDCTLTVPGNAPASTTIPLAVGWNMIGWPSNDTVSIGTALASLAGKYSVVYAYDANDPSDPWKMYDPALPAFANDLQSMAPNMGYWIYMTVADNLLVTY